MQYIPCNSALLPRETLFLTPKKKHFFVVQRCPNNAKFATNLNIVTKYCVLGLKIAVQLQTFRRRPIVPSARTLFHPPTNLQCALLKQNLLCVLLITIATYQSGGCVGSPDDSCVKNI